jgi:hypothetical protein
MSTGTTEGAMLRTMLAFTSSQEPLMGRVGNDVARSLFTCYCQLQDSRDRKGEGRLARCIC